MKGSIVKRGNTFSVIVETTAVDPVTGKLKRKRKWFTAEGAKTKAEASTFLRAKLTELESGVLIDAKKQTVADYLESWLKRIEIEVQPRTHERYAEIARNNLTPLLGSIILSQLKPAHISEA